MPKRNMTNSVGNSRKIPVFLITESDTLQPLSTLYFFVNRIDWKLAKKANVSNKT